MRTHSNKCLCTFCKPLGNWALKNDFELENGFGHRLGFLVHILGFIKSLGLTHGADHFGSDLISCHWDQEAWILVRTKWGVNMLNGDILHSSIWKNYKINMFFTFWIWI